MYQSCLFSFAFETDDTPLLINIDACGYPPEVNCTIFMEKVTMKETSNELPYIVGKVLLVVGTRFENFASSLQYRRLLASGEHFPCHYSKSDPAKVLETYSYADSLTVFLCSLLVPPAVFAVSLAVLLHW